MIRRYGTALRAALVLADAGLAIVTAILVYEARFRLLPGEPAEVFAPAWPPLVLYAAAWVLLLSLSGQYRLRSHWTVRSEIGGILRTAAWLAAVIIGALFLLNLSTASRVFLFLLFPIQAAVTIGTRLILRAAFMMFRSRGYNNRNLLIVGTGADAVEFAGVIEDRAYLGLRIIGFLGREPDAPMRWPYLGDIDQVVSIMHQRVVDEVAICLSADQHVAAEGVSSLCQEEGKIVRIPILAPRLSHGRRSIEDLDGLAVISMSSGPDHLVGLAAKRAMDIIGSLVALVILSPLLLAVTLYILHRGGRPVLFAQTRVGRHGRRFRLYKFRTMVRDAEERLPEIASLNHTNGPAFKVRDDPRITTWGRFLRRSSIDELPQLWNVLKGDMSLVGPRPAPPREVDLYDLWHRRRLSMKPGITGLWQISSRLDDQFDERAILDLSYIDRWSLWLDIRIVLRTLPAMLRLEGH